MFYVSCFMKTYELTYIASPTANQEELEALKEEIGKLIQSKEGAVLKLEGSTAKTLSYPIKKQISGYFTTVTFNIAEGNLKEVSNTISKEGKILRSFIIVKNPAKEMKARNIRRFSFKPGAKKSVFSGILGGIKKVEKTEKVEVKEEEINKKLDEILSE